MMSDRANSNLGHFDACISSVKFFSRNYSTTHAQYVSASIQYKARTINLGFCLPGVCRGHEIEFLVRRIIPAYGLEVDNLLIKNVVDSRPIEWGPWENYFATFFTISVIFALAGVIYEWLAPGKPAVKSYSTLVSDSDSLVFVFGFRLSFCAAEGFFAA